MQTDQLGHRARSSSGDSVQGCVVQELEKYEQCSCRCQIPTRSSLLSKPLINSLDANDPTTRFTHTVHYCDRLYKAFRKVGSRL